MQDQDEAALPKRMLIDGKLLTIADVGAVGEALTTSPDVDVVTFTGSTATGRRIMAAASATIKRVFLELGGKSALVVLDDADATAPAMVAAFGTCSHAGQGCAIPSRMVVPRQQHDAIAATVAAMLGQIKWGDPADPKNYMGPLISERQRDKVDGLVKRALAVARQIRTGTMSVNGGAWFGPDVPFGGYKQSGVGREMGTAGLEEFLETKSLAIPVAPTPVEAAS